MTHRFPIVLFLIAFWSTENSQCIDRDKITYGGDWDFVPYVFHCPTYRFQYDGDTSSIWSILDFIDIRKIEKQIAPIKNSVEQKIRAYSGEIFFERVKFSTVEIVYPDSL